MTIFLSVIFAFIVLQLVVYLLLYARVCHIEKTVIQLHAQIKHKERKSLKERMQEADETLAILQRKV